MPQLTVLHLEDEPLDAELILAALEEGDYQCRVTRVDTRDGFLTALEAAKYDIILADYSLPSFDGVSALQETRDRRLETPFILISGALGEDHAINSLTRGATDYVLKHRLDRLRPAVDRALSEARNRAERHRIEEELAQSEARLRFALEGAGTGTWHWDLAADNLMWSDACRAMIGAPPDAEVTYDYFLTCVHPDDRDPTDQAVVRAMTQHTDINVEYRVIWPDGAVHWLLSKGRAYFDAAGQPVRVEGILQNIDDRKQSEAALAQAYERETLVNRIGQAVRETLDPSAIKTIAVTALAEALDVDYCYYVTYDIERDVSNIECEWRREHVSTVLGEYRMSDYFVSQQSIEKLAETQVLSDTQKPSEPPTGKPNLLRALIRVPLSPGVLQSALVVAMLEKPRSWSQHEVMLVETVAAQTQAALEAARSQRRERTIATILQEALQPATPEHVPGLDVASFMRAALHEASIGGDFFDVFALDKQSYAFVIGDVSGKGLAAAAQVSVVRNMLRSVLYQNPSVGQATTTLNAILAAHDLLTGFVTLFAGVYDAAARRMVYTSCGHEPALIYRAATGDVEELKTLGTPLGVDDTMHYTERDALLFPGDIFMAYTDGLSEAGPNRREMLGTDGLKRLLETRSQTKSLSQLAANLVSEATDYSLGVLRDDACLLLARVV
ncbi:hypothetical protein CCAX7_20230 [Capsulimonas corticalis]|uniref:Uncharacterized protein n=1 Tax=Capsulimonas corticalis TaxID=2219043 RepID=A0A402D2K5_9BACT|nr:SpoIIE family protein phosphatase [Capsulimonas corticalis]BDI29972.1 hypothetical protein CCAX7_20230 [Capsulimonas corticalis]